jgi:L-threonylcarbamoyladenylate synthase
MMSLDHAARLLPLVRAADQSGVAGATTLHLQGERTLCDLVNPLSPIVLRALAACSGQPVTMTIELSPSTAGALPGAAKLAIENSRLHVRVAPRTETRIGEHAPIVIGDGLQSVQSASDAAALISALAKCGVDAQALGTSTPANVPSTVVDFPLRGGFAVTRVGMVSREQAERLLTINVLLVCTGNTCRSPMAEAIARSLVERLPPGSVPFQFRSAGIAAEAGAPPTPEAVAAVRAMGITPPTGRAQALTPELAGWADVIYTMTESHERAARRLAPGRAVSTLDLQDIPDPIGQGPAVYKRTAEVLQAALAVRLAQLSTAQSKTRLHAPVPPAAKDHP